MIINNKRTANIKNLEIKINNELIQQVDAYKYLGVYIDNREVGVWFLL